jgi:aryl-alcohol dehydrogenase-like predicted oxidoreductase
MMKYRLLGRTGLRVSELCLGTMTFGLEWGWGSDYAESKAVFDLYAESGGNFLDTANRYTEGTSEKYLADFIAADRSFWVVGTKYSLVDAPHPNGVGNHRKNLVQTVEGSLKRLKTDYIDLLWLHAWDFTTHPEEVMRALDDLVRAGKVLHIGNSDTPAWIVAQCNTIAQMRGWTPFCALQIEYSLVERTPERDLIPMARALGLTVTPWSALGMGVLTGKYNEDIKTPGRLTTGGRGRHLSEKNLAITAEVIAVAQEIKATPSQVALRWLLEQPDPQIPILGARTPEQMADQLECLNVTFSLKQRRRLDEASAITLGFPHDFLRSEIVRNFAFDGQLENLINPEDPINQP